MGILWLVLTTAFAQDAAPAEAPAAEEDTVAAQVLRSDRMEFDERLVKGSTAAGSVYLFKRRARALPALVPVRQSFRSRILEAWFDPEVVQQLATPDVPAAAPEAEDAPEAPAPADDTP